MFKKIFTKLFNTLDNDSGSAKDKTTKVITNSETKKKKNLSLTLAQSMLQKGETLDKQTLHKTTADGIEMKYCSKCGRWLPLDMFHKDNTKSRDGLHNSCKECSRKYYAESVKKDITSIAERERWTYEKASSMLEDGEVLDENTLHKLTVDVIEMKYCLHCKRWLPLEAFNKREHSKDGLQSTCKECRNKYYKHNKNKKSQQVLQKNSDNPRAEESNTIGEKVNEIMTLITAENNELKRKLVKTGEELSLVKKEKKNLEKENCVLQQQLQGCFAVFDTVGVKYNNGTVEVPEKAIKREDVELYLKTHNDIPLRVFFNCISRADVDKRYRFFYTDSATGMTTPIAQDVYDNKNHSVK